MRTTYKPNPYWLLLLLSLSVMPPSAAAFLHGTPPRLVFQDQHPRIDLPLILGCEPPSIKPRESPGATHHVVQISPPVPMRERIRRSRASERLVRLVANLLKPEEAESVNPAPNRITAQRKKSRCVSLNPGRSNSKTTETRRIWQVVVGWDTSEGMDKTRPFE